MPGLGAKSGTAFRQDLLINRPVAEPSLEGFFFFALDDNLGTLYQCNGTTWVPITGGLRGLTAGPGITLVNTPSTVTINNSYSLPIATSSILGGIKVGDNLSIDGSGVISGAAPYTLPTASGSVLGGVKVGTGLSIDGGGVLSSSELTDTITFVINGGGATIATGIIGDLVVPYACTIQQVTLLADQTTNAVIDIWKQTYASFPPTVTEKITASAPPTITTAIKSQDSILTGWTISITAGDVLRFNVNSCSAAQLITVSLQVARS